jgi:DhnA family fructose-bisphosphate aldolase class Ia
MRLGKLLRLRRIFSQGRALAALCEPPGKDPVGSVRLLARSGVDAVLLTPGLLELVAEELGSLAVILRIDGGSLRPRPLVSVRGALEMGADAVALEVNTAPAAIERFGCVSEEARRLGMPLLAQVAGEDWREAARLSADYGADLIGAPYRWDGAAWRECARATGKPLLVGPDLPSGGGALLEAIRRALEEPAQGILLGTPPPSAEAARLMEAIHALVHQDVSLEEARGIAGLPPLES